MNITQMEANLEQARNLKADLGYARNIVDTLTKSSDPEFPVFASVDTEFYGRGGRVALPSVARSVVLEAARAQVDTILSHFRSIGVEPD